jgi:dTMP kinase
LPRDFVVGLERLVHPGLQPNATFLFDVDPAVAYERQRVQSRSPDKFEREEAQFFIRVREAYLERAREHSRRFHVIDASGNPQQVRDRIEVAFAQAFH